MQRENQLFQPGLNFVIEHVLPETGENLDHYWRILNASAVLLPVGATDEKF